MRRLAVALSIAGLTVVVAGCGSPGSSSAPASLPPLATDKIDELLLRPSEIDTVLGATAIAAEPPLAELWNDSPYVALQPCRAINTPAEESSYERSGFIAVNAQRLQEPGDKFAHLVKQAVVLLPTARDAAAFFAAQGWSACPQYTATFEGKSPEVWMVGPVSKTINMMTLTRTAKGAKGWACERALSVRNNVVIDIMSCSHNPADTAASIARHISTKVSAK